MSNHLLLRQGRYEAHVVGRGEPDGVSDGLDVGRDEGGYVLRRAVAEDYLGGRATRLEVLSPAYELQGDVFVFLMCLIERDVGGGEESQ